MPEYRSQTPARSSAIGTKTVLLSLLLVSVGYWFGAITINRVITKNYWVADLGDYQLRLATLEEMGEDISTVFVGSSHTLTAINPFRFDIEMAANSAPELSFNLSEFGAIVPIQRNSLRYLEELQLPQLHHVFFEPMLFDIPVTPALGQAYENIFSTRNRYFYDFETSQQTIALRWSSDRLLAKKLLGIIAISTAWLIHESNLGVVKDILTPAADSSLKNTKIRDRRGYMAMSEKGRERSGLYTEPDIADGYRQISTNELLLLDEFVATIRRAGAAPVFIFPPARMGLGRQRAIRDAVRQRYPEVIVMDYTFDAQPLELYFNKRLWADDDHLNVRGATAFSRILARDWQRTLDQQMDSTRDIH